MAYGDYDGPNKRDKGQEGGSCNRTRCQAPNAFWYNHGACSWYCAECRAAIGLDPYNKQDWEMMFQPRYGHPQFETRKMMEERENGAKTVD